MKFSIYILLFSPLFFSCEKEVNKILPDNNFNDIIIDAFITDEYKNQEVIISKPTLSQNDTLNAISNASIRISNGITHYTFTESDSLKGHYFSDVPFASVVGEIYLLEVKNKSAIYNAETYMLPVTPVEPLLFSYIESSEKYKIDWVANTYTTDEQAMYEVQIKSLINPDSLIVKAFYYSFNTVDVSQVFASEIKDVFFPTGSKIIEKKYSLTPEYVNYIRALASETMWQGGLFSEAASNLPTNIEGGAIGYFSTCAVNIVEIDVN